MKVLLATAADMPWSRRLRTDFAMVATQDRVGDHALTTDPDNADLILLLDAHQHPRDWSMRAVRTHPYVRAYPEKSFVYDERDIPRDALPGVYVSMPRRSYDRRRHRAISYLRLKTDTRAMRSADPDLLFSFQGRRIAAVRDDILALRHPRAVAQDTSDYDFFGADNADLSGMQSRYREVLGRSKFVLCPRGSGTASFRLFEALAAGRVPVILSDEWVEPGGIAWEACSVRIAERDAPSVARRLEELEPEWPAMSTAACVAFDDQLASDVWFHHIVEACRELREEGSFGLARQWTTRAYWRSGARHWKHNVLKPRLRQLTNTRRTA